ncbi:hypothetical protein AB0K67_35015 [Nonomuraea sp. NPDC052634]|uniref:hypothetical protein n=1 Tax=Nonomuraea sp. NPDC052634 TaxID=3155813 RepID=UPI0034332736
MRATAGPITRSRAVEATAGPIRRRRAGGTNGRIVHTRDYMDATAIAQVRAAAA